MYLGDLNASPKNKDTPAITRQKIASPALFFEITPYPFDLNFDYE